MARYVAFLRGVSPTNITMPALTRCLERAGFSDVRTLLASGNAAFSTRATPTETLRRRIEAAIEAEFGRRFGTFVRSATHLRRIVDGRPFDAYGLPPEAKPVVTFLPRPWAHALDLPIERADARILAVAGTEAYSFYVPGPKGPVFMALLERTFGRDITTRTLATVTRCARA